MAGLIDIGPISETVDIRGTKLDVPGLSAEGVLNLFSRFPALRELFEKRSADPQKLLAIGGEALGAVLASGTGSPGSPDAEAIARRLPLEVQADLLAAIWRVSFPNGFSAFGKKLESLMQTVGAGEALAKAPATKSRKPSST